MLTAAAATIEPITYAFELITHPRVDSQRPMRVTVVALTLVTAVMGIALSCVGGITPHECKMALIASMFGLLVYVSLLLLAVSGIPCDVSVCVGKSSLRVSFDDGKSPPILIHYSDVKWLLVGAENGVLRFKMNSRAETVLELRPQKGAVRVAAALKKLDMFPVRKYQ